MRSRSGLTDDAIDAVLGCILALVLIVLIIAVLTGVYIAWEAIK